MSRVGQSCQELSRVVQSFTENSTKIEASGFKIGASKFRIWGFEPISGHLGPRLIFLVSRLGALGPRVVALGLKVGALGSRFGALRLRIGALGQKSGALGSSLGLWSHDVSHDMRFSDQD